MKWTTAPPSCPGYYWCKHIADRELTVDAYCYDDEPTIGKVGHPTPGHTLMVILERTDYWLRLDAVSFWSDIPIQEPEP